MKTPIFVDDDDDDVDDIDDDDIDYHYRGDIFNER